jgi:hypothetical protein
VELAPGEPRADSRDRRKWRARNRRIPASSATSRLAGLVALDRYERRAVSRRNRAIRMFQAISIVAPFLSRETKGR